MEKIIAWVQANWAEICAFVDKFYAAIKGVIEG